MLTPVSRAKRFVLALSGFSPSMFAIISAALWPIMHEWSFMVALLYVVLIGVAASVLLATFPRKHLNRRVVGVKPVVWPFFAPLLDNMLAVGMAVMTTTGLPLIMDVIMLVLALALVITVSFGASVGDEALCIYMTVGMPGLLVYEVLLDGGDLVCVVTYLGADKVKSLIASGVTVYELAPGTVYISG